MDSAGSTPLKGRPPKAATEGKRASLNTRLRDAPYLELKAVAALAGRSLSEEIEARLEASLADKERSFGRDNAGLVALCGEVVRALAPQAEWLDSAAANTMVARGLARVVRRLLTPEDGHISQDGSPEARADAALYDLGLNDDSRHARWAAEKRDSYGPVIGPRLVAMHEAVKAALEAMPPCELPKPDGESAAAWERVTARVNARRETEGEGGDA